MLTQQGPGAGGSIPALVMRTGLIQPVNPANARRDVTTRHVLEVTSWPVDETVPAAFLPMLPSSPAPQITPLLPAPPSPTTTAVAQTTTAVPPAPIQTAPVTPVPAAASDRQHWHIQHRRHHPLIDEIRRLHPKAALHGAITDEVVVLGEWMGRPIAKFEITAAPPQHGAQAAANGLCKAARVLMQSGLASMPPELVAGPLAALMRGGAVELHFQNGVVVRTAL